VVDTPRKRHLFLLVPADQLILARAGLEPLGVSSGMQDLELPDGWRTVVAFGVKYSATYLTE
jgi:hypothetical protein